MKKRLLFFRSTGWLVFLALVGSLGCDYIEDRQRIRGKEQYYNALYEMKMWALAFEHFCSANNGYPESDDIRELRTILRPFHDGSTRLKRTDPWDGKYIINSTTADYIISTPGADGIGGHAFGGALAVESYDPSITLQNGRYVQHLESWSNIVREYERELNSLRAVRH
jgi:hypothetical protein